MNVYFDASVIVSFVIVDAHSHRIDAYISRTAPIAIVSDFAVAEVASALNQRIRIGSIDRGGARAALTEMDLWKTRVATSCLVESSDIAAADAILRRFDLTLRTPDAIHIAVAQRLGVELATFDERMADCARNLGVALADV